MKPFGSSLASEFIRTLKLSENKIVRVWLRPKANNIMLRDVDRVSFICIFPSLPSTRPFGRSLALEFIGTPKLSEFKREQSQDG
ncbi:hypothetical protein DVH24_011359 [Malus domestica]|uniref:Uncharacterized protein n=1 Tax=Malus domestica TaxID=3750 RepID=A0A498JZ84_MALDO|nr:hypothetical protein DVH24_011359 [Malus domestica]